MDERNGVTIGSALGEAAFKAALRAVALLLVAGALAGTLAAAATISSALDTLQAEPERPVPAIYTEDGVQSTPADEPLLLPAKEPDTRM